MALEKYYLNLAGEYRVASELLKRGLFATSTYVHMKGIGIYVMGRDDKATVVEVKACTPADLGRCSTRSLVINHSLELVSGAS